MNQLTIDQADAILTLLNIHFKASGKGYKLILVAEEHVDAHRAYEELLFRTKKLKFTPAEKEGLNPP